MFNCYTGNRFVVVVFSNVSYYTALYTVVLQLGK